MSFDLVLEKKIKPLGKWQFLIFFSIVIFSDLPVDMLSQLANLTPNHVCSAPWFNHWTYSQITNFSKRLYLIDKKYNSSSVRFPEFSCYRFDFSSVKFASNLSLKGQEEKLLTTFYNENVTLVTCPGPWLYDKDSATFRNSIIESFDLVCQNKTLLPNGVAWYFAGIAIGNLIGGQLGDRFGRRFMLLMSYPLQGVLIIAVGFSTSFQIFAVIRFFVGVLFSLGYTCGYVFIMEITNSKHRNTLSVTEGFIYSVVSQNINVAISYLFQDWRIIHYIIGTLFCTSVIWFFFLPESPRWLIAKGRNEEALRVVHRAIWLNTGFKENAEEVTVADIRLPHEEEKKEKVGLLSTLTVFFSDWSDFLGNAYSLRRLLPMSWLFFTTGCLFFSLSFYAVRLPGNPYLIASLATLLAVPPKFLQWFLYDRFDRKKPVVCLFFLSFVISFTGFLCRAFGVVPLVTLIAATLVIGLITAIWDMLYVFTSELFPTLHRNKALGCLSFIGSIGSFSGMYIERMDQTHLDYLPLLVYTVMLFIAFLSSCFVPPIQSSGLTDTYVEEAEDMQEHLPMTTHEEHETI